MATSRRPTSSLATHLPFMDRGLFFAKAHPHRSYAVAAPIDPDEAAGRDVHQRRRADPLGAHDPRRDAAADPGRRPGAQARARRRRARALRRPRGFSARALAGGRPGRVPLVDAGLHVGRPRALRRAAEPSLEACVRRDGIQQVGDDRRHRRRRADLRRDPRARERLGGPLRLEAAESSRLGSEIRQGEHRDRLAVLRAAVRPRREALAGRSDPGRGCDPAGRRIEAGGLSRRRKGRCTSSRRSAGTSGATWSGTRPSGAGTAPATARATRATAV